jgi:hypothetical protein
MPNFLIAAAGICLLTSLVSCTAPYDPYDPFDPQQPRFRPTRPTPREQIIPLEPSNNPSSAFSNPSPAAEPPVRPNRPVPPAAGGYPTATRTANAGQVLSPYEPYNVIDIEGFKTGQLARDPSNQKIFRIP